MQNKNRARRTVVATVLATLQFSMLPAGAEDLPESWVNPPRDEVRKAEFTESERAPLVSMGPDGHLVYRAYSDRGDRIIDFSTAGYMRSEVPIPSVPVVETLSPLPGEAKPVRDLAYPVGPDSFERVQAALDRIAAMPAGEDGFKGALLLQNGTWYISRGLLVESGVVLRGEGDGENGTVIVFTSEQADATGIQIGSGAGGTTEQTRTTLTGILTRETETDLADYRLTFSDGRYTTLNNAKFDVDYTSLDEYLNQRVEVILPLMTTTQGNERWYSLKHDMPYEIREISRFEMGPPEEPGLNFDAAPPMPETRIADAYVPTGASKITVEDASLFQVGDLVDVLKTTNEQWIEDLGVGERLRHIRGGREGAGKTPWKPTDYSHLRTIAAIDGDTITLDVMMPQSIAEEHGGGTVRKAVATEDTRSGVESIRVISNYDETQDSNSRNADYANLRNGIGISAVNSWVRDCTVLHVSYAAVRIDDSRFVTVRDCKSLQPVGPVRGGFRYTYAIGGGNNVLVYNCYAEDGRHDFVLGARMAGPYVFLRSTAVRGGQSEPHARWGVGTLFDNITMKDGGSLAAINRGDSGSGHGWAAANTVFWNADAPKVVVFDPETDGEGNFAFGYKGPTRDTYDYGGLKYANTRAGYWGTPREGVYYGYPLMGSGHIESPGSPMEPDSLFEQQLIDRIGREQAEAVLD
jgi:hypothetical protein